MLISVFHYFFFQIDRITVCGQVTFKNILGAFQNYISSSEKLCLYAILKKASVCLVEPTIQMLTGLIEVKCV